MKTPRPNACDEPINCPHCKVNLLDKPVPNEYRVFYAGRYFKREIGVTYPEIYDGVYHYKCPDCSGTWGGYAALKASPKV